MLIESLLRTSTSLLVALALVTVPLSAQAGPPPPVAPDAVDEVRLVTGGFIKGEIVEYMPGGYVVIVSASGEPRRVLWVDIAEIVRDGKLESISVAQPQTQPQLQPKLAPHMQPQPEPQPQPQPQPEPQPVEGPVEPAPEPEPQEGTYVHLEMPAGKLPISLYHVDGEAYASSGGYSARAVAYSEICMSPCDIALDDVNGEFFVAGDKYRGSKRFRLYGDAPRYDLSIKPGSKGLAIGGYLVMVIVPSIALGVAMTPLLDMPMSRAKGIWIGSGFLFAAGLGGGIAMMVLSRTKVRVTPRSSR